MTGFLKVERIITFVERAGTRELIGGKWTSKSPCFWKTAVKQAMQYLIENYYFNVGNYILRQCIGIAKGIDPAHSGQTYFFTITSVFICPTWSKWTELNLVYFFLIKGLLMISVLSMMTESLDVSFVGFTRLNLNLSWSTPVKWQHFKPPYLDHGWQICV